MALCLLQFITSFSSLVASYSIYENIFFLYCLSNLFIGIGSAFVAQYRFAAAESVTKEYAANCYIINLICKYDLGALIGPNIATLTKDIISNKIYTGSYIFLSILTIIPFFFFLFYSNEKLNISDKKR